MTSALTTTDSIRSNPPTTLARAAVTVPAIPAGAATTVCHPVTPVAPYWTYSAALISQTLVQNLVQRLSDARPPKDAVRPLDPRLDAVAPLLTAARRLESVSHHPVNVLRLKGAVLHPATAHPHLDAVHQLESALPLHLNAVRLLENVDPHLDAVLQSENALPPHGAVPRNENALHRKDVPPLNEPVHPRDLRSAVAANRKSKTALKCVLRSLASCANRRSAPKNRNRAAVAVATALVVGSVVPNPKTNAHRNPKGTCVVADALNIVKDVVEK